jgi:hypothetical protein
MSSPRRPTADDTAAPDDLDWDVDRDGRMRDYATDPMAEPLTEPWQPDEDETEV